MRVSNLGLVLLMMVLALGCTTNVYENTAEEAEPMSDYDEGLGASPKRRGWSASGNLKAKNNAAYAGDKSEVGLQAVFDTADIYTVTIDLVKPDDSTVPIRAVAYIEWAVAGNTILRRVSVSQTVAISAPAEGVKVRVIDETPNSAGGAATVYYVAVAVARGVRTSLQRPTLQAEEGIWTLQAGTTKQFVIPKKAGVVAFSVQYGRKTLFTTPIPDGAVQVSQNNGLIVFTKSDPRAINSEWITLEAGARQVEVINYLADGPIDVTILWAVEG